MVEPAKNGTNRNTEVTPEPFLPETTTPGGTPLCQRLLAALISEEENDKPTCSGNDDFKFDVYESTFEFRIDAESEDFGHASLRNLELNGRDAFSVYGKYSTPRSVNRRMSKPDSEIATGLDHSYNGLLSDPTRLEYHYGNMSMNERLLLEIQSIGLYPQLVVGTLFTSLLAFFLSSYNKKFQFYSPVSFTGRATGGPNTFVLLVPFFCGPMPVLGCKRAELLACS